ncbi:hypothetical protein [Streptomyces sp. NPDC017941]|uniref:hypothetical protein n=1 Tax=unclassified Streptomyces TaxID=2593676 RepID=UPI00378F0DF0
MPDDAPCSVPAEHDPEVTRAVYRACVDLDVSSKVRLAAFEAGWVESHMNNLACGDQDSVGVFQQRPSQGWGTVEQCGDVPHATASFLRRAVDEDRRNPGWTAGRLAQAVQRSSHPERYDQAEAKARSLIEEAQDA